jgi:hypothetical protein
MLGNTLHCFLPFFLYLPEQKSILVSEDNKEPEISVIKFEVKRTLGTNATLGGRTDREFTGES